MAIVNGDNDDNNLVGTAGDDEINGFGGNDILFGDLGKDIYNGGDGDDRFDVASQAQIAVGETYNGGLGFDTLNLGTGSAIDLSATIINADVEALLAGGAVSLTAAQLGNFVSVSSGAITLTTGGVADLAGAAVSTNTFNLNAAGNTLSLAGVSTNVYKVFGGVGNDTITGGDHTGGDTPNRGDTLNGGEGADTISGGLGDDFLTGGGGLDTLDGGAGDDFMYITAQAEIVSGESYAGGTGFDRLVLESRAPIDISSLNIDADVEVLQSNVRGAVSLTAAQLGNFISIGTGAITLTTGGVADLAGDSISTDRFNLNAAGNTFSLAGVSNASYFVFGGVGNDIITGGDISYGDWLEGGAGDDTISGGLGGDRLDGGAGLDALDGGAGNDILYGFAGDDSLGGGAGNDMLDGGIGADVMAGATGDDAYYVDNADDQVIEAVGEGNDTVYATADYALAAGQEVETLRIGRTEAGLTLAGNEFGNTLIGSFGTDTFAGGAGDDTLYGHAGDDSLDGGAGDDMLYGLAEDDSLDGGAGDDMLNGGIGADVMAGAAGDDAYFIDDAGDQVIEAVGGGNDTVYATADYALAAGQEVETLRVYSTATNLTLGGNEFDNALKGSPSTETLDGGAGNDMLYGFAGDDSLDGGAGDDMLNGGIGADVMAGAAGDDAYFVDNAGDQVIEAVGGGNDTVYATADYALAAGQEVETLRVYSTAMNLTLEGNEFDNTLIGGAGADTLIGAAGDDKLRGAGGADHFRYGIGDGSDSFVDFNGAAGDRVDLFGVILQSLVSNVATLSNGEILTAQIGYQWAASDFNLFP